MTNQNTTDRFQNRGITNIEEQGMSSTTEEVLGIFKKYPTKYFTQKDFVEGMGKSNPFINKILRTLVEKKKILRSRSGNKFFYKVSSQ